MTPPRDSTFQLGFSILPLPEHEGYETHGEAFAACWILHHDLQAAEGLARAALAEGHWQILELEYSEEVSSADYEQGDELLEFFEQAQVDREVYVFHMSPRHPVCRAVFEAHRGAERAEAHFFVSGESLSDGASLYDVEFWSSERVERVRSAGEAQVVAAGWQVASLLGTGPICFRDLPASLQEPYDQAEEHGDCLTFAPWTGEP